MTDKELSILIRSELLAGLIRAGQPLVEVIASHQPRHQGRVNGPVIYLYMLDEHRYGWQGKKQVYNEAEGITTITESQLVEQPIQATVLYPQDPTETTGLTAKDIANTAAMIVNSILFSKAINSEGVGVQRVTEVRNPYFENDRGQYEASPSFDFTVSHKRIMVETDNSVAAIECNQTRV